MSMQSAVHHVCGMLTGAVVATSAASWLGPTVEAQDVLPAKHAEQACCEEQIHIAAAPICVPWEAVARFVWPVQHAG